MQNQIRLCAVVVAAALGLATAGCGQADDRDQARAVTERFYAAVAERDGATACRQLSGDAIRELEDHEQAPCAEAVVGLELGDGSISGVEVAITNAKVERSDGEVAYLDRARDGWRLSAVGCRFEDGKPRDRPATCEAAA